MKFHPAKCGGGSQPVSRGNTWYPKRRWKSSVEFIEIRSDSLSLRLGKLAAQESALGFGARKLERGAKTFRRLTVQIQFEQQMAADGEQQIVVSQCSIFLQDFDRVESRRGSVNFGDGDGAIQRHHGRRVHFE